MAWWFLFAYVVGPFVGVAWFALLMWGSLRFAAWREDVEGEEA